MILEELLPWLAGVLGVAIVQWAKRLLSVDGKSAMWVTTIVSFLLAIVALLISGGLSGILDPAGVFAATAKIMAVATILYKAIISKA